MNDRGLIFTDERREFEHLVRSLDSKYLDMVHEKMSRERERLSKASKSSTKGGRKR